RRDGGERHALSFGRRGRAVPAVPGRDERTRELRSGSVPRRGAARPPWIRLRRPELRLQPQLRLQPGMVLPAPSGRELAHGPDQGGGEDLRRRPRDLDPDAVGETDRGSPAVSAPPPRGP